MTRGLTLDDLNRLQAEKEGGRLLPPPSAPMDVARTFVGDRCLWPRPAEVKPAKAGDGPSPALTLRHWRGGWWQWRRSHWREVPSREIEAKLYEFTETARFTGKSEIAPWAPNRKKIGDLLAALAAICWLPDDLVQPGWIDRSEQVAPIVACANGLLDVSSRTLHMHTPWFFNGTAVPFDYDADAPTPENWERFLTALWANDEDSVKALQEWFGYIVSGRLDLHKIMLLVGPTRAGKGVVSRTLGKLIGRENVAGPTLSSLSGDFGLAPLLGKSLAVVSDARLNGRGAHVTVERLLSISGEDTLTVNRKYRDQWTGKLPARLMLCSNELPQLGDASAAVAGRFVPLILSKSFYGQEDLELEGRLTAELPGILNWALGGLKRLTEEGHFTRPENVDDTLRTLEDLASPVGAFVRDCCETKADRSVEIDVLYRAFSWWAESNGHVRSAKQVFGRDLRAVMAGRLKVAQPGAGDNRQRHYEGIDLTKDARADLAIHEAIRATERGRR